MFWWMVGGPCEEKSQVRLGVSWVLMTKGQCTSNPSGRAVGAGGVYSAGCYGRRVCMLKELVCELIVVHHHRQ